MSTQPTKHPRVTLLYRATFTIGNACFAAHHGPATWAGLFFAASAVYMLGRTIDVAVDVWIAWSVDREMRERAVRRDP